MYDVQARTSSVVFLCGQNPARFEGRCGVTGGVIFVRIKFEKFVYAAKRGDRSIAGWFMNWFFWSEDGNDFSKYPLT